MGGDCPKLLGAGGDPECVELGYEPLTVTEGEVVRAGTGTAAAAEATREGVVSASS